MQNWHHFFKKMDMVFEAFYYHELSFWDYDILNTYYNKVLTLYFLDEVSDYGFKICITAPSDMKGNPVYFIYSDLIEFSLSQEDLPVEKLSTRATLVKKFRKDIYSIKRQLKRKLLKELENNNATRLLILTGELKIALELD